MPQRPWNTTGGRFQRKFRVSCCGDPPATPRLTAAPKSISETPHVAKQVLHPPQNGDNRPQRGSIRQGTTGRPAFIKRRATAVAVALRSGLYSARNGDASSWRRPTPRVQCKLPRLPRQFARLGKQPAEVTQPEHPSGRRGSTASQSRCSANLSNTIVDIIHNLEYPGFIVWGLSSKSGDPPVIAPGRHEPIVSIEEFELAGQDLASKAPNVTHPRQAGRQAASTL